jgi:hypothetical protein
VLTITKESDIDHIRIHGTLKEQLFVSPGMRNVPDGRQLIDFRIGLLALSRPSAGRLGGRHERGPLL